MSVKKAPSQSHIQSFREELKILGEYAAIYQAHFDNEQAEALLRIMRDENSTISDIRENALKIIKTLQIHPCPFVAKVKKSLIGDFETSNRFIQFSQENFTEVMSRINKLPAPERLKILSQLQSLAEKGHIVIGEMPSHWQYTPTMEGFENWNTIGQAIELALKELK